MKKQLLSYYYILSNLLQVQFSKNIQAEGKVRLLGPISMDIARTGKLNLGNGVTIVSGMMINPLGRNILSSIRIDDRAFISIGNNVGISNVCLWAKDRISIGDNVKIGADCLIMDSDMHSLNYLQRREPTTDAANANSKQIIIEDDVFIGTRSIINKGVHIGKRSIIAAGSVVVKSIPADEIWGGNPAVFLKKIQYE